MEYGKELKKAMIDNGIDGAKSLSDISGVSYNKTIRAINGDPSCRLTDVAKLAETLKLKLSFKRTED